MIEVYLFIAGLVFIVWLYALVRQTRQSLNADQKSLSRPVVPVNLMDSDEAVIVAEDRGRIVFANAPARQWFGINGGVPNLMLMAQLVQPADALHNLLADAGQASFRLGQRQIDAVSHVIPHQDGSQTVLVMRELTTDSFQPYTEFDPLRALAILEQVSQEMGSNLDLQLTINTILQSVEHAIPYDFSELTLWYAESETLHSLALHQAVSADALDLPENRPTEIYQVGEGYSGWIAQYRQPLLVDDIAQHTDINPQSFRTQFQSYIGVPLTNGEAFVGTLELYHHARNAFRQQELALLQLINGQIAAVIQTARLHHTQKTRVAELSGLQRIAEAMGQLGELSELFEQLSTRIANLMEVELCGVLIYDESSDAFRSQPPFYGVPDALIANYRLELVPGTELYSIWNHRPWWFTNDPQSDLIQAMGFDALFSVIQITSLALMPMIVGARRTGLLMVANKHSRQEFTEQDMRSLMAFAAQAAVVVENARLYHDEQRRTRELGGLQQIAQAIGVLHSPAELYNQITARVAALMNVQMCGILLFDAKEQVLISQRPFYGMEDEDAVDFYQLRSPPDSAMWQLWQENNIWFSNDLQADPLVRETDLATLTAAVGITQSMIATLVVGGNRLGIIQASNQNDGLGFTEDDARILSIFAGQAAILIDNARLYREMQHRTHEAEGLRAITEIVSYMTPNDDTVERVLIAIANLLESQIVAITLIEEDTGELVLAPNYIWGASLAGEYRINTYLPGFVDSVFVSQRPFISHNVTNDQRILPVYQALMKRFALQNVIQVPLVVHNRSIGELIVGNRLSNEAYSDSDVQFLIAIAPQITSMVDRMQLHQTTDQDLKARIQELNALSQLNHELGQLTDLNHILDVIRQEILRSTEASAVSIVLLADRNHWEAPDKPQIEQRFGEGRVLRSLTPAEITAISRNDVLLIEDVGNSEFEAPLPNIRSVLIVPVVYGENVIGLIHLFSTNSHAFNQQTIDFVLELTDQATVAISNTRRYQEQLTINRQLRTQIEQGDRIFEIGEKISQEASLAEILELLAHNIQEATDFNTTLISLVDERTGELHRIAQVGISADIFEELQQSPLSLSQVRELMQEPYQISQSYFLPAEDTKKLTNKLPLYRTSEINQKEGPHAWAPNDLLLVPLDNAAGELLGMISVSDPLSGMRPELNTVETLEIFANQAAFSIENSRLIQHIHDEAEAIRSERDRLAQLHIVASEIQNAQDVPSRLQIVADGIRDTGWQHVIITLLDEHLELTSLIQSGYMAKEGLALYDTVPSGEEWRARINDLAFHELKLGTGYYLRYDEPWVQAHSLKDQTIEPPQVAVDEWHPQDVFYLSLVGQDQKRIIGMIAMQDPLDGRVPTAASLQPLELFAAQASATIETTRLYLETVRAAEQEQRINEIMEALTGLVSPSAVLEAFGQGLQQTMPFTRMSLALYDEATDQFDMLYAAIAPDVSVQIRPGEPLAAQGTVTNFILREKQAHVYHLADDEAARKRFSDLNAWYNDAERSSMLVPMIAGGKATGVLRLGIELQHAYGFEENLDMIQRMANLTAVALDNTHLFEQARERAVQLDAQARRLALINRVATRVAQAHDMQEIYEIAIYELQEALGAYCGGLLVFETPTQGRIILDTHPDHEKRPDMVVSLDDNLSVQHVRETHKPLYAEDIKLSPYFEQFWSIMEVRGTCSTIVVPLIVRGEVIATVGVDFQEKHTFTATEIELTETIANQVSVGLEKTALLRDTEQRAVELNAQAQQLALINRISTRLAQTLDMQQIYSIMLTELQDILQVHFGGFMLVDEAAGIGRLVADTHPMAAESDQEIHFQLEGNRSIERVIETREPLISEDVLSDPLFERAWEILRPRGTKSLMIVPLLSEEKVLGTIGLDSTEQRQFTESEVNFVVTVANQVSLAIEKARLYNETYGLTVFNQAVVESIQHGIIVLDQDLKIRRVNHFMAERYQWTAEAIEQPLFSYRPHYAAFLREPIAIVLTVGNPQVRYGVEQLSEDEQVLVRNYYVYPMREGKAVTGIVLLIEDVTERTQLEADLEARALQMAALSEVSSQITAMLEPQEVITLILDALGRVIPYDGVSLWLRSEEQDELRVVAARGYRDPDTTSVDDLLGLTVEIPFSPLFREMAENVQVINAGDVGADKVRFPYGSAALYKNWLGVPLTSTGRVVGVLALEKHEPHFYDALHEQLALTFANQAAVALDNAQFFKETQARAQRLNEQAQRLALLNRVSLVLAQTLDLENIYEIALREAAIALNAVEGSALQINNSSNLCNVIVEYPRGDLPPEQVFDISDHGVIARARETLIPVIIDHSEEDNVFSVDLRAMMRRDDIQSSLFVPLVVGGELIGGLRLDTLEKAHKFTPDQIELAQTIASQAATAAQNAALFEQGQIRTSELETLFKSAQATAVTLDLDEVMRRVRTQMLNALDGDAGTVFLWDEANGYLIVRGEISVRTNEEATDHLGDLYRLEDYPLREKALRDRELIIVRNDDAAVPPSEAQLLALHNAASRIMIPLVVNDISIGLVEVEMLDAQRHFTTEAMRLARTLASQAAISIENARLQTETRRTVEELYIINDMSEALSSANTLEDLLEVIDAQLPSLTDAHILYVALYNRETEIITFPLATSVYDDQPLNLEPSPLGEDEFSMIIRREMPLLLAGENLEDARRGLKIETVMPEAQCFLGVPISAGDELFGVLAIRDDKDPVAFDYNDQRILTTISAQFGVAIQSTRLFQQTLQLAEELDQRVQERTIELEQERQHISALYAITTELASSLNITYVLHRALNMVAKAVGASQGVILAVDQAANRLLFRAHLDQVIKEDAVIESPLPVDQGLAGWAIQNHENLIIDNVQEDPRWRRVSELDEQPRAAIVSLIESSEDVLGVMMLFSETEGAFHDDQLRLVTAAASQVANAMSNAELYNLIRDQAERLGVMLREQQVESTKSDAILDSVADGVIVADESGHVILCNTAASRILNMPVEHVLNLPTSQVVGLYGAGNVQWATTVEQWLQDHTSYQPGEFLAEDISLEDERVISVRLSPVYMDQQFLGTVSIFRDVTREVEVDRLKSEFVATVSHELRTPMTSIKGYADLLLLGAAGEVTDQQQHFLDTIKQNADRLSVLVNDLLNISRIDQGDVELRFISIEVEELLNLMQKHLQERIEDEKRPLNISIVLPEDQPLTIWGDYEKIIQILTNLVDNAFSYTFDNGAITLSAAPSETADTVIIQISDNGIGITPEAQSHIFERFFRGDETHELVMNTPGTGLGLAIVRELVELHRGRIWFESEIGTGTTFFVELPTKNTKSVASS